MTLEKRNVEAQLVIEQPFLKVPFEALSRTFRNSRKVIEKEIIPLANQNSNESADAVIKRLTSMKRKLSELQMEEQRSLRKLKCRISELKLITGNLIEKEGVEESETNTEQTSTAINPENLEKYEKTRLNRLVVDYLLRKGFHSTAELVLKKHPELEDLVDVEVFSNSRQIEKSLLENHSCQECLQWCLENKSALKRFGESGGNPSNLEYSLREQEFIVLIKDKKFEEAIQYSKKNFPPFQQSHIKQIQKVMLLLAFTKQRDSHVIKAYFDDSRWKLLANMFRKELLQLNSLPNNSLLTMAINAGLPALKTPMCYSTEPENKNIHCPTCNYPFNELAANMPYAFHANSCCVCKITGDIMDENNYCMVLPNGNAYSMNGISLLMKQYAQQNGLEYSPNDSNLKFYDPRTSHSKKGSKNELFSFGELKKAFLM